MNIDILRNYNYFRQQFLFNSIRQIKFNFWSYTNFGLLKTNISLFINVNKLLGWLFQRINNLFFV